MPKYQASNIVYDTDGEPVEGLPETVDFEADDYDEALNIGADEVSDRTGWCVHSLSIDPIGKA